MSVNFSDIPEDQISFCTGPDPDYPSCVFDNTGLWRTMHEGRELILCAWCVEELKLLVNRKNELGREMDEFDRAIVFLTKYPQCVKIVWMDPDRRGGALFGFLSIDGSPAKLNENEDAFCGCLTQVKCRTLYAPDQSQIQVPNNRLVAFTQELTDRILKDDRISASADEVGPQNFEAFAEYQREMKAIREQYDHTVRAKYEAGEQQMDDVLNDLDKDK